MPFAGGLVGIAVLALWLYCILDVIATDEALMRNMPKVLWLVVVILLPTIGSVAWLILGRPREASLIPGDTSPRHPARPVGPEDSPNFMSGMEDERLRRWEQDLKRREEELRRREDGEGPPS